MKYADVLQSIGFSESEANIYLSALELGPTTAIQIAKKASLSRQMVYALLDQLTAKGLMKIVTMNGKRLFKAMNPEVLQDRGKMIMKKLEEVVPVLKTTASTDTSLPTISVYENPVSMREWYHRFMQEATTEDVLLIWATNKTWYSVDQDFLDKFIKFKNEKKLHDKIIVPDTPESRAFTATIHQPYAEFRYVKNWWQTAAEKWIWRDTVSYLTISENATNLIVLESAQLAAIEKFNFELVWQGLENNTQPGVDKKAKI